MLLKHFLNVLLTTFTDNVLTTGIKCYKNVLCYLGSHLGDLILDRVRLLEERLYDPLQVQP